MLQFNEWKLNCKFSHVRSDKLTKFTQCCIRWEWEGQEGVAYLPGGVWLHHNTIVTDKIPLQVTDDLSIGGSTFSNFSLTETGERQKYTHAECQEFYIVPSEAARKKY